MDTESSSTRDDSGSRHEESDSPESSTSDHSETEPEAGTGEDTPGGSTQYDDLSHQEKAMFLVANLPETASTLRETWSEETAQFYFLAYSLVASLVLLYAIAADIQVLLYGGFIIYAITAIPLLYVYENGFFDDATQESLLQHFTPDSEFTDDVNSDGE